LNALVVDAAIAAQQTGERLRRFFAIRRVKDVAFDRCNS
jgi:hypothetical protein